MKTKEFWQIADNKSVSDLIKLLEFHTLDPRFLNYGRFAGVTKKEEFNPKYEAKEDKPYIFCNFYDLSFSFQGKPTKGEVLQFKKEVAKHVKTERFVDAFNELYNCVSLELTYFYNAEMMEKFGSRDEWYGTIKSDMIFPINGWFCPEFKEEWKRLDEQGRSLKHATNYKIKVIFKEVHFVGEEYNEVIELLNKHNSQTAHTKARQAIRAKYFSDQTKKSLIEYTFKCTGRKVLYNPNDLYSFSYEEVEPIITKPTKL